MYTPTPWPMCDELCASLLVHSQNHVFGFSACTHTKSIKSGKEKSQTINYRDKCAREWSQISFCTRHCNEGEKKHNWTNKRKKTAHAMQHCNIHIAHCKFQTNKETDEQAITKRSEEKKFQQQQ